MKEINKSWKKSLFHILAWWNHSGFFFFLLKDVRDEEPVISGVRELKKSGP